MTPTLHPTTLLAAAMRAHDRAFGLDERLVACDECGATWHGYATDPCDWCLQRRLSDKQWILRPPPPRHYGHATADDLAHIGYSPELDRAIDLEHWRKDLQIAADAGLITEDEGTTAWRSATQNNPTSSTSSTGTNCSPTKTTTKTRSFPALPSEAAGQRSTRERKPGSRRS